jgi:hypothetical protein
VFSPFAFETFALFLFKPSTMKPLSWLLQNHYTVLLMILATIAALIISIKNYRRHRELRIFTFYILFSLTQDTSDFYRSMSPKGAFTPMILEACATLGFLLFEFAVWTYFVLSHITSSKRRRIVKTFPVVFLVIMICFMRFKFGWVNLLLLNCTLLALPCFFYFYELFLQVHEKPLKDQPSFWTITGILFFNCCSIPLYLNIHAFGKEANTAFSLNYLLYTLFFALLIRAYLCNPAAEASFVRSRQAKGFQSNKKIDQLIGQEEYDYAN